MSNLKFVRVYYKKYDNSKINIENGILVKRSIVRFLRLIKRIKTLLYSWVNLIYAI